MKKSMIVGILVFLVFGGPSILMAMGLFGAGKSLPLLTQKVTVTIDNQVALTRLDQSFMNSSDQMIEATYRFPLGEKASVQEYGLTGKDKIRHPGSIEEKHEAEAIFQNAQNYGATPAIGQQVDPNVFETKIGTIPGREIATVDLSYSEILSYHNGTILYSIPMNLKNIQDKELDLSSVVIDIKDQKEIVKVTSPSHASTIKQIDSHHWQVTYEKSGWLPDSDFQLSYEVKAERMGMNFLSTQPVEGENGFFMMLLAPQEVISEKDIAARDIVFVMDTSGSMQGQKLEQTKAAFNFFIDHLNGDDRFGIVSFSDGAFLWKNDLVAANKENREEARQFIYGLSAGGGTNIDQALCSARNLFPKNQSTKAIVFLTDGQPTAGITGIEVISQNMTLGNIQKIRTFVFGVGEDVSTQLLDKIALENRGEAMYVRPNEDLSAKLTCFYETISKPLLVDLSIDWGGINVSENFPKQIPNVYKGSQLVVVGRYSKGGPANVKVSGELNGKRLEFPLEVNFVENNKANRFVSRQWAKTKADSLIQEIRAYGEDPQKKAEVIKLSKTFQFTTPYTSFIAVDPVKVVSNSDLDKFRSSKQANSLVSYQPSQGNWTSHGNSNIDDTTDYRAPAGQVPTIIQNAQAKKPSLWGFFPAALLVPNFKKAREQARGKACCANMRVILGAVEMYNMDHSVFATKITDYDVSSPDSFLIKGGYLKNTISRPEAGCKYGATGDLTTTGQIFCALHNTVNNFKGSNSPVNLKIVTTWDVELWNKCLPVVELLINIPLMFLSLYIFYFLGKIIISFFSGIFRFLLNPFQGL